MNAPNSYSDFLEKARQYDITDLHTDHWEQQIQQGRYYKFYKETKPGIYVLDFTQQRYLYCNDIMASYADYPIPELMSGGLNLALKLWHPDDLKIYDRYILPINLAFLKSKSVNDYGSYLFTCNYRVRQRKGNYVRVEQSSFFSKSLDDGTPLMTIGFLRDVTNRMFDNSIIHTIEHVTPDNNKLLHQKVYNPDNTHSLLTPREIDVLELVIKGNDSKKIAVILEIDKSTVDNHRKNMLRKTNSQNMVQVVIAASKSGIIKF